MLRFLSRVVGQLLYPQAITRSISTKSKGSNMHIYTHQTGTDDIARLQLLNEIHNPGSINFIKSSLSPEADILDVGCGQGHLSVWMAKNTKGRVIGIDSSEVQIAVAQKKAATEGISNVEFRVMSAFDIDSMDETFDLIYGRFLLVHIQNPERVVKAAASLLRPKGSLLWEEATASASFCYPNNDSFDQWMMIWKALREAKKTELDAGLRLPQWFAEAGLANVSTRIFQPILNTPREKEILWRNIAGTKKSAIEVGFRSAEEVDRTIHELKDLTSKSHLIGFVRNSQTKGEYSPTKAKL